MDIKIRKAKAAEAKSVFDLVNSAYSLELGSEGVAFARSLRYRKEEHALRDLGDTFVAEVEEEGGEIVACVRIVLREEEAGRVAVVGPLAVSPERKGKGLGRRMMAFAETLAPVVEVDVVSCRTDNLAFYDRLGSERTGKEFPVEDMIPKDVLTREGLTVIILRKKSSSFSVEK